jgi:hypothetical protein
MGSNKQRPGSRDGDTTGGERECGLRTYSMITLNIKCALRESNSLQAGLESATLSNEYRARNSIADYMTDLFTVNRLAGEFMEL